MTNGQILSDFIRTQLEGMELTLEDKANISSAKSGEYEPPDLEDAMMEVQILVKSNDVKKLVALLKVLPIYTQSHRSVLFEMFKKKLNRPWQPHECVLPKTTDLVDVWLLSTVPSEVPPDMTKEVLNLTVEGLFDFYIDNDLLTGDETIEEILEHEDIALLSAILDFVIPIQESQQEWFNNNFNKEFNNEL